MKTIKWTRHHAENDGGYWYDANGPDDISLKVEPVVDEETGFPEALLGWEWDVYRAGDADSCEDFGTEKTAELAKAAAEKALREILAERGSR